MNKNVEISLDSELFRDMKMEFDELLQTMLRTIVVKNVNAADINLKLHIGLVNIEDSMMNQVIKPEFSYKLTCEYKQKADLSGTLPTEDQMLVMNENNNRYALTKRAEEPGLFDEEEQACRNS